MSSDEEGEICTTNEPSAARSIAPSNSKSGTLVSLRALGFLIPFVENLNRKKDIPLDMDVWLDNESTFWGRQLHKNQDADALVLLNEVREVFAEALGGTERKIQEVERARVDPVYASSLPAPKLIKRTRRGRRRHEREKTWSKQEVGLPYGSDAGDIVLPTPSYILKLPDELLLRIVRMATTNELVTEGCGGERETPTSTLSRVNRRLRQIVSRVDTTHRKSPGR